MLVLAHTGITLGAAVLLAGSLTGGHQPKATGNEASKSPRKLSQLAPSLLSSPLRKAPSWLASLGKLIDIRLLLAGALLPDIIDKPLGQFFFRETFSSGRIFGHTLLFLILITMIGLYLYRSRAQRWLLVLAFGTLAHLILDLMWQAPKTVLWPLLGFAFEKQDITNFIPNMFNALFTDPRVYVPELVGVAIIIWFSWILLHRRRVYSFIRFGRPS
ncbi:MAG: metal-dependent hydrolase [Dehalococcoidales bacterium]